MNHSLQLVNTENESFPWTDLFSDAWEFGP